MWTAATMHWLLNMMGITIGPKNICVLLAPFMASNTTLVTYLFGVEVKDRNTGLIAAAMIAVVPGYISRSVAGSFDNEGVAIFALVTTFYLFVKAMNTGSLLWAGLCSLAYFYMSSSWGGYIFVINLLPLYVFIMLVAGRYTHRLYVAYSTVYVLGTLLSMQIRFVGFQAVQSSEHMAAAFVFVVLQLYAVFGFLKHNLTPQLYNFVSNVLTIALAGLTTIVCGMLYASGYVTPWTGRFYSLLDPTYAKEHIPILASVAEHQPTTWASFFFDLHILVMLFPTGLYYCFKGAKEGDKKTDAKMFLVLYGISAIYFAGAMVRLMLVLAPVACMLGAVAVSNILQTHMPYIKASDPKKNNSSPSKGSRAQDELPGRRELAVVMVLGTTFLLFFFVYHSIWVTSEAYSSPSIVLTGRNRDGSQLMFDDFREAYYWLRTNTAPDSKILSWWDYGYQITAMANRTVIVDNNTWNNTHISQVGKAMAANETAAYRIMTDLDVDYVMVIFGGLTGFGSDDINKFLWMVRIGGSVDPDIKEEQYFSKTGEFSVGPDAPPKMLNCLMYKLCYYRFGHLTVEQGQPTGFDRVRQTEIGRKNFDLEHFEEAYSSEHWIVRIYKVKKPENRW